MNREEAIERIRGAGFSAHERDWSLGPTIVCLGPGEDCSGITKYEKAIHIFPTAGGWGLDLPGHFQVDCSQHWSLEEATHLALGILTSEHLPLRDEDILITVAKVEGGDSAWMEHRRTGLHCSMYGPGVEKGARSHAKDRARREITFKLAMLSWKGSAT